MIKAFFKHLFFFSVVAWGYYKAVAPWVLSTYRVDFTSPAHREKMIAYMERAGMDVFSSRLGGAYIAFFGVFAAYILLQILWAVLKFVRQKQIKKKQLEAYQVGEAAKPPRQALFIRLAKEATLGRRNIPDVLLETLGQEQEEVHDEIDEVTAMDPVEAESKIFRDLVRYSAQFVTVGLSPVSIQTTPAQLSSPRTPQVDQSIFQDVTNVCEVIQRHYLGFQNAAFDVDGVLDVLAEDTSPERQEVVAQCIKQVIFLDEIKRKQMEVDEAGQAAQAAPAPAAAAPPPA